MQSVYLARVSGPLAPFAEGFRAELDQLGYTPASREYKVNQMAGLSRWLDAEGPALPTSVARWWKRSCGCSLPTAGSRRRSGR